MKRIAVIPAYEPPESFVEYAQKLLQEVNHLIVVNDGSDPRFDTVFDTIREFSGTTVISYRENRGKGYALKKAFSHCAAYFADEDILVTADCDGQHSVSDVAAICKSAAKHPDDCVLGVRDFTHPNVPPRSKAGNTQMLRLLRQLYDIDISDSQTGLRGFTVKTARLFTQIRGDRFEYETGMLIYAKHNHIPIREIPIQTIYPEHEEDHVSHFKTFQDSFRVIDTMLSYLPGGAGSGLLAGITDMGVFTLLACVAFPKVSLAHTIIATVVSRVVSTLVYLWDKCKHVCHGEQKPSRRRFFVVWTGLLLCSCGNIYIFSHILGGNLVLIKLNGDCILALLTYRLRHRWIYEEPENQKGFYGRFARFAKCMLRLFSRRYRACIPQKKEPVVYVCRHLNMHGPFTTLKWLPSCVHPMVLHVFFDKEKTVKHMTEYTFSVRYGKKQPKFSVAAHVMSWIAPPMMRSLQAVPVYRGGAQSIRTLKCGLEFLLKGEDLIVYPDVDYTGSYEKPTEIYQGFLLLGDLYYKKTGKALAFVPLCIDDDNRRITEGDPVFVSNYRKEGNAAANNLKMVINKEGVIGDHQVIRPVASGQ